MPKIGEILIEVLLLGFAFPAALYLKGKYFFKWNKFELRLTLIIYYLVMLIIILVKNCSCSNNINIR